MNEDTARQAGLLRAGEKLDDLQRNGLMIIQDPEAFCFGMDAVLLSAYVPPAAAGDALDLGTGNGILPLLLSARTECRSLTGLEIQAASADMALRSVKLNGLEERISIIQGDIKEADRIFPAASFDVVTANPPYMAGGHGLPSDRQARYIARHEALCAFPDVAAAASHALKAGGHFYLVHRPFRLAEIIRVLCAHGLEPKRMRLVHPYAEREPNMVLLDCVRGGRPRLQVEKPLIVYERPGVYTKEILEIYGMPGRDGEEI